MLVACVPFLVLSALRHIREKDRREEAKKRREKVKFEVEV